MNFQRMKQMKSPDKSPQHSPPLISHSIPPSSAKRPEHVGMPSHMLPETSNQGRIRPESPRPLKHQGPSYEKPKPAIKVDMISVLKNRKQNIRSLIGKGPTSSSPSSQSTGTSSPVSKRLGSLTSDHQKSSVKTSTVEDTSISDSPLSTSVTSKQGTDILQSRESLKPRSLSPQFRITAIAKLSSSPMKVSMSPTKFVESTIPPSKAQSPLSIGSQFVDRKSLSKDRRQNDASSLRSSIKTGGSIALNNAVSESSFTDVNVATEKELLARRNLRKAVAKPPESNLSSSSSDDISSTDDDWQFRKYRKECLLDKLRQTESAKSSYLSRRRERRQWFTENDKMSEQEYAFKTNEKEPSLSRTSDRKYHKPVESDDLPQRSVSSLRRQPSILSTTTTTQLVPERDVDNYTLTRKPAMKMESASSIVNIDSVSEPSRASVVEVVKDESSKLIINDILREQTQQFHQQLEEQKQLQLQLQKQQKVQLELQKQQQELQKQLLLLHAPSSKDNAKKIKEITKALTAMNNEMINHSVSVSRSTDVSAATIIESAETIFTIETASDVLKPIAAPTSSMIKTVQEILDAKQKLKMDVPSFTSENENFSKFDTKFSLGSLLSSNNDQQKQLSIPNVGRNNDNFNMLREASFESSPTLKSIEYKKKEIKTDCTNENQMVRSSPTKINYNQQISGSFRGKQDQMKFDNKIEKHSKHDVMGEASSIETSVIPNNTNASAGTVNMQWRVEDGTSISSPSYRSLQPNISITTLETTNTSIDSKTSKLMTIIQGPKFVKGRNTPEDRYSSTSLFSNISQSEMSDNKFTTEESMSVKKEKIVKQSIRRLSLSPARVNNVIERKRNVSPPQRAPTFDVTVKKLAGNTRKGCAADIKGSSTVSNKGKTITSRSIIEKLNLESDQESLHQPGIKMKTDSRLKNERQNKKESAINIQSRVQDSKTLVKCKLKHFFNDAVANLGTFMEINTPTTIAESSPPSVEPGPSKICTTSTVKNIKNSKGCNSVNDQSSKTLISKKSGKGRKPVTHEDKSMTDAENRVRRKHTFESDVERRTTKDDESLQVKDIKRKMMAIDRDQRLLKLKRNMKRQYFPIHQNTNLSGMQETELADNESTIQLQKQDQHTKSKFNERKDSNNKTDPRFPKQNVANKQNLQSQEKHRNEGSPQRHGSSEHKYNKPQMTLKRGFGDVERQAPPTQMTEQTKHTKLNSLTSGGEKGQFEGETYRIKQVKETSVNQQQLPDKKFICQVKIDSSDSIQNTAEEEDIATSLTCMGDTTSKTVENTHSLSSSLTSVPSDKTIENQSHSESSIEQMMLRLPSTEDQLLRSKVEDSTDNSLDNGASCTRNTVKSVCNLSTTFKKFIGSQGCSYIDANHQKPAENVNENEEFAVAVVSKKSNWINQNVVVQSLDKISSSLWHLVGGKKTIKTSNEEQESELPPYLSEEADDNGVRNQQRRRHLTPESKIERTKPTIKIGKKESEQKKKSKKLLQTENKNTENDIEQEEFDSHAGRSQDTIIINTGTISSSLNTSSPLISRPSHFAIAVVNENCDANMKSAVVENNATFSTDTIIASKFVLNDTKNTVIYWKPMSDASASSAAREKCESSSQAEIDFSAKAKSIVSSILGATGYKSPKIGNTVPGCSTEINANASTSHENRDNYTITVVVMEPIGVSSLNSENWQAKYAIEKTLDKLQASLNTLAEKQTTDTLMSKERTPNQRILTAIDESLLSVTMILMDPGVTQATNESIIPRSLVRPISANAGLQHENPGGERRASICRITSWSQIRERNSEDFCTVMENAIENQAQYLEQEESADFLNVDIVELELKNVKQKKNDHP